jgi:hypothetical protein
MRDLDVRKALHKTILQYVPDDPDTLIIDEFGICQGQARVDIAVINGNIHGFEIKSESDNLERLPNQVEFYSKVLETITIVTSEKHLKKVRELVPRWWGIIKVIQNQGSIKLKTTRKCKKNPEIDPHSLVQLVWLDEAKSLLIEHQILEKPKRQTRKYVWDVLARNLDKSILLTCVRDTLKNRESLKQRNISQAVVQQT